MILAQQFLNFFNGGASGAGGQKIINEERLVIAYILNWIRMIGTGLALIMLTVMALRYINVGPDKKRQLKEQLVSFAIGAIVFIGASNLIYYISQIIESFFN